MQRLEIEKEITDKSDCFAWLNEKQCNALSKKDCKNCSFYKHYLEVQNYQLYLPKGFKRNTKNENYNKNNNT